jgi:hypothetical protein
LRFRRYRPGRPYRRRRAGADRNRRLRMLTPASKGPDKLIVNRKKYSTTDEQDAEPPQGVSHPPGERASSRRVRPGFSQEHSFIVALSIGCSVC